MRDQGIKNLPEYSLEFLMKLNEITFLKFIFYRKIMRRYKLMRIIEQDTETMNSITQLNSEIEKVLRSMIEPLQFMFSTKYIIATSDFFDEIKEIGLEVNGTGIPYGIMEANRELQIANDKYFKFCENGGN